MKKAERQNGNKLRKKYNFKSFQNNAFFVRNHATFHMTISAKFKKIIAKNVLLSKKMSNKIRMILQKDAYFLNSFFIHIILYMTGEDSKFDFKYASMIFKINQMVAFAVRYAIFLKSNIYQMKLVWLCR